MADFSDVEDDAGDVDEDMPPGSEGDAESLSRKDRFDRVSEASAPIAKEAKNRLDLLFLSDEEFDGPLRQALRKKKEANKGEQVKPRDERDEGSPAGDWSDNSELSDMVGNKRKSSTSTRTKSKSYSAAHSRSSSALRDVPPDTRSRSPSAGPAKKRKVNKSGKGKAEARVEAVETSRKYNLGTLAQSGQGGRVMFVFEKKSDGKMLD